MPTKAPSRRKKTAKDLGISPEVAWFMKDRGIPLPSCPPRFRTPEPRDVAGARFDPERVDKVLRSFAVLKHTQGKWAGKPLTPDPWQVAYIIAPVYGWVHQDPDGDWVRIIRTEYVELPRKNGKTTLAGGQAVYLTGGDGEPGAQVVAVAASKDQAGFCFAPIKALVEGTPALKEHFKPLVGKVIHPRSGSYFQVVSSVADLMHGANLHGAVIDELHIHKTRDTVDAVETGTGARAQPLIIIITTADANRPDTIYSEKRDYVEQLCAGTIKDPTFYGVIWACDGQIEGFDPFSEAAWVEANPGYGISPTRAFMESEANKARQSPANLARFCRLHLGIRTKQETKYFDLETWDASAGMVVEADLEGRDCYGGLDLSTTTDLTAFALAFPDDDGGFDLLWRLWAPEARLVDLDKRTAGQASVWVKNGLLSLTPGDIVDYDHIRTAINLDRERFAVKGIGFDPWNSSQVVTDLMADDAPMEKHRQGFASMSAPTKQMLHLLLAGKFRHGGNPALRWQADNFAVETDAAGNVKPSKKHAGDKIDGIVAGIMAVSVALENIREQEPEIWVDYA